MFDDGSNNQWSGSPDGAVNERNDMRKKLKLARVAKDIGTEEMSKRLGITRQAYYLIERGISYPKLEVWKKIQNILGLADEEMWEIIKGK